MTPEEHSILRVLLAQWSISFVLKTLVFGGLFAIMIRQRAKTAFGTALTIHYLSIAVQAMILAVLYAQYRAAYGPGDGFLTFTQRIWLYRLGSISIWAVVVSGAVLICLYFRTTSAVPGALPEEGSDDGTPDRAANG